MDKKLDKEMKETLDRHAEAAEKDKTRIPLRQLIDEGRAKLQVPTRR
jgi:predicted transcriptional regulator